MAWIRLRQPYWRQIKHLPEGRLEARAGVRLKQICGTACRQGLSGFEYFEGIPGSLGGALRMNAGAMEGWIFERVERVSLLTWEGQERTVAAANIATSYRNCLDIAQAIAVSAVLRSAHPMQPERIRQIMAGYASRRQASQPHGASVGCIFKKPQGNPAGQLIEELGLKGLRRGGAEVSPLHGNFIINRGGASSTDIIGLIQAILRKVRACRGIDLEPEVLILGRSWGAMT